MAQWLAPGPIVVGVYLPYAFDLSGIALGAVIVLTMALRPSGVMGENQIEDFVFEKLAETVNGMQSHDPQT